MQKQKRPKAIKQCVDCGTRFLTHIARLRCNTCKRKFERLSIAPKYIRICAYIKCKKTFLTNREIQRFHNRRCRKKYHSEEYYAKKET